MAPSHANSVADLSLPLADTASGRAAAIEQDVLALFDRCAPSLFRYVRSLGLPADESEDVVQDVFLLLFRHLRLDRSRANLRAWLFQVAHNQALKRHARARRHQARTRADDERVQRFVDPAPSPETSLAERQRRRLLMSVVRALPARDRRCLALRAQGLPYRDIASVLGVSLGTVAKSLTRAISRLSSADER
jgi:RNA polymerase sigma-70 factor, ECF subfamily